MLQDVNVKKDAEERLTPEPMPEEKTRPLVLRIEALEQRVAPTGLPDLDANGH
jgi:hypothetical protein